MHDTPRRPAGSVPLGQRLRDLLGIGSPRAESLADVRRLPRIHMDQPGAASGIEHHELTQPQRGACQGDDHLHRLFARLCASRASGRPRRFPRPPPARVVGRALDQHRRAVRHERAPGVRREIRPAPAGGRRRGTRRTAAESRRLPEYGRTSGAAVHHRPHAGNRSTATCTASRSVSFWGARRC